MRSRVLIGSLALVLVMFATARARDAAGGRLAWERDVDAAVTRAKSDHRPLLLYFTHDESEPDGAFDRGALSDDAVVAMARDLDANANAVAIEHLKLENEGWERVESDRP
jgi:hypothetical protein